MDKKFHTMLDKYVPKFATEAKLILPKLKRISTVSQSINSTVKELSLPNSQSNI